MGRHANSDKEIRMCTVNEVITVASGITTGGDGFYIYSNEVDRLSDVDKERIVSPKFLEKLQKEPLLRKRISKNGINLNDDDGRTLVPYDKPGRMSSDTLLMFSKEKPKFYIDWSEKSVNELRNNTIADNKRRSDSNFIGNNNQNSKKPRK